MDFWGRKSKPNVPYWFRNKNCTIILIGKGDPLSCRKYTYYVCSCHIFTSKPRPCYYLVDFCIHFRQSPYTALKLCVLEISRSVGLSQNNAKPWKPIPKIQKASRGWGSCSHLPETTFWEELSVWASCGLKVYIDDLTFVSAFRTLLQAPIEQAGTCSNVGRISVMVPIM